MSEMPPQSQPDETDSQETAHIMLETDTGQVVEAEVPADKVDEIAEEVNKGASY